VHFENQSTRRVRPQFHVFIPHPLAIERILFYSAASLVFI
jgi:hypothetical protein